MKIAKAGNVSTGLAIACIRPLNSVRFLMAGLALAFLPFGINAQAPSTMVGDGVLIHVTSGTYPLASYGYAFWLFANSGNTYQLIGIYNSSGNSGTYSYTATSFNTAQVVQNDITDGFSAQIGLTLSGANQGSYSLATISPPGYSQAGYFMAAIGTAPTSIAGKSIYCTVSDGLYPLANSGYFTIAFSGSGNSCTVTGAGGVASSSGTYSYSVANRASGAVSINDSVSGASTAYFGFSTTASGVYAVKQASGGFQVGSFAVLDTTPPTINITTPTSSPTYSTTATTVNLAGTASDDTGVTRVTWSNSRGGAGNASGTGSWSANDVPLQSGANLITVTAYDAAKNAGTATLTVTNLTRVIGVSGNLAFGNVTVGDSASALLTVTNSGTATLTVSNIAAPAGFAANWSGTVPPGGFQSVTVTFSPSAAIIYGGSLLVNSDATGGANSLGISGTGTLPVLVAGSGPPDSEVDIALGQPATESSTWSSPGYTSGDAWRANDGGTDGNYADGSVAITFYNTNAWWQVDLGSSHNINTINVWGRTDCCTNSNYYLFVSDNAFTSTDLQSTLHQSGVSNWYQSATMGSPTSLSISRTGRYVRVQLAGTNYLSLAEVQVFEPDTNALSNSIVLSWSTNAPGYTLVFATNLPPARWFTSAVSAVVAGGRYTVTDTASGPARFYRLKR
jgi:hypothetical protein